jgi:predicted RNA-binding Zn-ribbon protein involved in translation (DUF1610 family)
MFDRIRRWTNRFWRNSRTINNEPLNPVNLIVIVLIDIFILVNVFVGLDDISQWYISPAGAYPCYSEWAEYQKQTVKDRDFNILKSAFRDESFGPLSFQKEYQQGGEGHLGTVSPICLDFARHKDGLKNPTNQQIVKAIAEKQTEIDKLNETNRTIRSQYDSTLLEKLAGQPQDQSINLVGAEKAKQLLDENNRKIETLTLEITELQKQLLSKPESTQFLTLLKDNNQFKAVEQGYQRASFWYPSIQLLFQALFLLPLIFLAYTIHRFARRQGYGLVALISWHLLVIFFIPLVLKIFQFLQVGALFEAIFNVIKAIFGGLLFLVSYVYILLIPLIGFGLIKLFQRFVINVKVQAARRVQRSRCIQCDRSIRSQDNHCPHCGFYQLTECRNCHELTYKYLPYCKQCGHAQAENTSHSVT